MNGPSIILGNQMIPFLQYFSEMSNHRKDAIADIKPLQFQISKHLVLIEHSTDRSPVNHWCAEVNAWLGYIQDAIALKKGGRLNLSTLEDILVEVPLGDYKQYVKYHVKQFASKGIRATPHDEASYSMIVNILNQVVRDIHADAFERIQDYL